MFSMLLLPEQGFLLNTSTDILNVSASFLHDTEINADDLRSEFLSSVLFIIFSMINKVFEQVYSFHVLSEAHLA